MLNNNHMVTLQFSRKLVSLLLRPSIFQRSSSKTIIYNKKKKGKWTATWQNQQIECAPSEDSHQCARWVAKDQKFLHADKEDSDQTGRMTWVFTGRTPTLLFFFFYVAAQIVCLSPNFRKQLLTVNEIYWTKQKYFSGIFFFMSNNRYRLVGRILWNNTLENRHFFLNVRKDIWATSRQTQQNGMCAQRWLSSAWASVQSDQSLCYALIG